MDSDDLRKLRAETDRLNAEADRLMAERRKRDAENMLRWHRGLAYQMIADAVIGISVGLVAVVAILSL